MFLSYIAEHSEQNVGQFDFSAIMQLLLTDISQLDGATKRLHLFRGPLDHSEDVVAGLWPCTDRLDGNCLLENVDISSLVLIDVPELTKKKTMVNL